MKNALMKKLFVICCLIFANYAVAAEDVHLDRAPIDLRDQVSLQRGAQLFANYCLSCHSAAYMRYNSLNEIGLSDDQIQNNLMFASDKVGNTMSVAMQKEDAKAWFGAAPPDLTVTSRSRGADWIYTYLRTFYRDESRSLGWNNLVYENAAMPHVLYELQGIQVLQVETPKTEASVGKEHATHAVKKLMLETPGKLTPTQYDKAMADLTNYMVYMGEPAKLTRVRWGILVLFGLGIMFIIFYAMKLEFWKDIK